MALALCPICAGAEFKQVPILWPALIEGWGLTASEAEFIDRSQGFHCVTCGCNLRSMALGQAIQSYALSRAQQSLHDLDVLEVNGAGGLAPLLASLPKHRRLDWPAVDLRKLPLDSESFDLVVHSDTLEHIADVHSEVGGVPVVLPGVREALRECRRVLRPGGALCFTVPTLVGKLTQGTAGNPPTYHDPSPTPDEGLRVHTEFGADVWAYCLDTGFVSVEFTCVEWPAGLAITARKAP